MSRALRAALTRLLEADDGRLSASQFTHAQQRALDDCRARTGALGLQRSGRGSVYYLTDRAVIERHLRRWRRWTMAVQPLLCPGEPPI
ncbi:hypothetical protein [Oceanisphaera psychrotolerans]|uniref:hypothetical protein n=1 Tax=Oceanisphaera psychrotolerans TaxID=1414654 RepID=UPI001C316C39|nr:hypothetical protein [Oceanisphaera psychrotolerans]